MKKKIPKYQADIFDNSGNTWYTMGSRGYASKREAIKAAKVIKTFNIHWVVEIREINTQKVVWSSLIGENR
jgi:hypothetical protein